MTAETAAEMEAALAVALAPTRALVPTGASRSGCTRHDAIPETETIAGAADAGRIEGPGPRAGAPVCRLVDRVCRRLAGDRREASR
ncbi:hypothetical protein [Thermaurantiacus sp.]